MTACFHCLIAGEFRAAEHWHHVIYDNDELPLVPLCGLCHIQITAMNCEVSRAIGYRRLTPNERCRIWIKFLQHSCCYPSDESFLRSCQRLRFDPIEIQEKWLNSSMVLQLTSSLQSDSVELEEWLPEIINEV